MSHVTDRIAEFVFEELPESEMTEARKHVAVCTDCKTHVEQFQQMHAMLRSSPDLDPPRNIVFEFQKPPVSRLWRWLPAAAGVAAAFVIAIFLAGPIHVQWHDSQLTIAFGQVVPAAETNQSAALATEIQNMQGHLAYLESRQQRVERDTMETASTIQLLARGQRSPSGD